MAKKTNRGKSSGKAISHQPKAQGAGSSTGKSSSPNVAKATTSKKSCLTMFAMLLMPLITIGVYLILRY